MRILATLGLAILSMLAHGQEWQPYPTARITREQWLAYFDEVATRHAAGRREATAAHLLIFEDRKSYTAYAFTQPGHPAHPAWVTRQPVQDGTQIRMRQIGYFAGDEALFAKMFRDFQQLNEQIRREVDASSN